MKYENEYILSIQFIFISNSNAFSYIKTQTNVPVQPAPEQSPVGYESGIIWVLVVSSRAVPSWPGKAAWMKKASQPLSGFAIVRE